MERLLSIISDKEPVGVFKEFAEELVKSIKQCFGVSIVKTSKEKEKALERFHGIHIKDTPGLWNRLHVSLDLTRPDPIWYQTVSKICF